MDLRAYLKTLSISERRLFADRAGTSLGYLRKLLCLGTDAMGPILCMEIERASGGLVTRRDLRPNDYRRIWPELR